MISISRTKYDSELNRLPFFNKKTVELLLGKKGKNLDWKISQLLKRGNIIRLKKGVYISERFWLSTPDKKGYTEYLANILYFPSYLSSEYILSLYNLIPEEINILTCISSKSTRVFKNKLGTFSYRNIKQELYCGYSKVRRDGFEVYMASKAKALFDFLYLKRNLSKNYFYELSEGLRINWDEFGTAGIEEFEKFVNLSTSKKMLKILINIKKVKNNSKWSYNQTMNLDRMKNTLSQQKTYLNDNYFVKDIGIFGSVSRGHDTKESDIDLLVEFSRPVGFFHFSRLEDYLSNVLKREVDLVTKDALKPSIKESVLKSVIYV